MSHSLIFSLCFSDIRALIWHNKPIHSVKAYIDGELVCLDMERASAESPLFTCRWDPGKYRKGLHMLTMSLEEEVDSGQTKRSRESGGGETYIVGSHSFSLDGTGERNSGFVGMFLGLPLLQWALAWMVLGVLVTTVYMLAMPQAYGFVKDWLTSKRKRAMVNVNDEHNGGKEDDEDEEEGGGGGRREEVERLIARSDSPYKYFVQERCWQRTLLLVFWPTVTTLHTMSRVPLVQVLSTLAVCLAPLVLPLAFGPAGPSGTCVFMGWGWVYCKGGSASIEFFMLIVTGSFYFMGVMPCLLVMGKQVRIIQYESTRNRDNKRIGLGRRVRNAVFEFWCFAVTFLFDGLFFLFFLITSGTLTPFMTPCVNNK